MTTISQAQERIKTLVENYEKVVREGKEGKFNEEEVKIKFILPFIKSLGWDPESDEVKPEQTTLFGRVDFSLRTNGREKIFFEIKSFSEDLSGYRQVRNRKESFAEQATNYAHYRKVDWAVLTNFKEIRLYYAHTRKPEEGRIFRLTCDEYLDKIDKLWLLSKESVTTGLLDTYEKRRTRKDIDVEVLEDLFECRRILAEDIYKIYRGASTELMRESIQRILDRLIVIRFMEDKQIEASDRLWNLWEYYRDNVTNKEAISFMSYLKKNIFDEFNEIYNSKIFEPHECDKLAINNATLKGVLEILYKYNFDLIDADVLGNIYEDYLGHVLAETEKGIDIVEKREKRKAVGVYYTPTYVVEYIVRNTVETVIEEKKATLQKQMFGREKLTADEEKQLGKALLKEIEKIKILDPACGSGSFLIKVFDVLMEYYDKYYDGKSTVMPPEKKILLNNLHGVDLDRQASEIASVNLMLKALRKGQKLPLILDENIMRGNSLISGTEEELRKYFGDVWEEKKPFNWKDEFKEIFDNGGFNVVIGNPPYGAVMSSQDKSYLKHNYVSAKGNYESYCFFLERGVELLEEGGYFGFIIPNTWLTLKSTKSLRKLILEKCCIKQIEHLTEYVFEQANVDTVILILQKEKDEDKRNNNSIQIDILSRDAVPQDFMDRKFEKSHYLSQKNWLTSENYDFNVWFDESVLKLSRKIEENTIRLGDLTEICRGINPYARSELIKKYGEEKANEIVSERLWHSNYKKDETYKKELVGSDISRYLIDAKSKNWISYGNWLSRPRDPKFFKEPHILVQRIRNLSLKQRIVATYTEEELYNNSGLTNIILTDKNYNLRYFLVILNSKMLNWYYRKKYTDINIKPADLANIPIKPLSPQEQKPFINLADCMLSLNKQYHLTLQTFQNTLENMKDEDTKMRAFKEYYTAGSDYDIDLAQSKKLIDVQWEGKVTKIEVREEGEFLILKAEYTLGKKENGTPLFDDIVKVHIRDNELRKFFYYSIKTFLMENAKKKVWGRGKIIDVVLNALKIPRFVMLKIKDRERISKLMEEFFKSSPIGDKSLSDVEKEIKETDKTIDQKVYESHGLTENEIGIIERS